MAEGSIPVENKGSPEGIVKPVAVEVKKPNEATEVPNIDLVGYYQTRVDQFKAEQIKSSIDFSILKNKIEDRDKASVRPVEEKPARVFSWQDKLRHKALLAEARLRGVKDLAGFQKLVEYFETTLTEHKLEEKKSKQKPSDEYVKSFEEKWGKKGFYTNASSYPDSDGKYSISAYKEVPVNLNRDNIPVLKQLLSLNSDPIPIIKELKKAGLFFPNFTKDKYSHSIPEHVRRLLVALHTKEALVFAKAIPSLVLYNSYHEGELSGLDVIVSIAESENPKEKFSPELVEKIGVLSKAMDKNVLPIEFELYEELINNPEKFNFLTSLLLQRNYNLRDVSIFEDINALSQANLLKPLTILINSGVNTDYMQMFEDKGYRSNGKTQPEIIKELQEAISQPQIQELLLDEEKQNFVGLVAELTGKRISPDYIQEALGYLNRKEELVYLFDLIYGDPKNKERLQEDYKYSDMPNIGVVGGILADTREQLAQTFTDGRFNNFLNELKTQGYEPKPEDFYMRRYLPGENPMIYLPGSVLIDVYRYKDLIKDLGESPIAFIDKLKALSSRSEASRFLNGVSWNPFAYQEITDKIIGSSSKKWIEEVRELPDYAQLPMFDRLKKTWNVDDVLIKRVRDLKKVFEEVNLQIEDFQLAYDLKYLISKYHGEIRDLFKDGEPTVLVAKQLIEERKFGSLFRVLTNKILNGFDESTRACLSIWMNFPVNIRIIVQSKPGFPNFAPEKLEKYKKSAGLLDIISNSSSKEIKKLQNELLEELFDVENPETYLKQIIDVFEKNNLPLVGKIFRVFEIMHPAQKLEEKIKEKSNLSPVLVKTANTERYALIYKDLLKVAIESGDPSLIGFLKALQTGQSVIGEIEQHGESILEGPNNTGKREAAVRFLNKMDTLYANSHFGRKNNGERSDSEDIQARIARLKANLGIKGNQSLLKRISALYLRPLGYSTIDQLLDKVNALKTEANTRNINFAREMTDNNEGKISLKAGDLLKGINAFSLDKILANGVLAREYLGASAGSDSTPFDTDTSAILPDDVQQGFKGIIEASISKGYGDLLIVIRNRGQFQNSDKEPNSAYDKNKYELFGSDVHGQRHQGIRTGLGSTELDALIVQESITADRAKLDRIFFDISQNGFYIPVVDANGKLLYTSELFEQYKTKNKEIQETLKNKNFKPSELIDVLKQSPYINQLYESTVGVWEGYKLDEHTLMVMGQYEKYFSDKWNPALVSQEGFRIMLALHDLGKPLAVQSTGNTANQHEYTKKFLPKIFEDSGLGVKESEILVSLATQDYLGKYMKGESGIEATAKNIKDMAEELGVPAVQLFDLVKVYYMCDAGAYTEDAGGKKALEHLFIFDKITGSNKGQMRFSDSYQQKIQELNKAVV